MYAEEEGLAYLAAMPACLEQLQVTGACTSWFKQDWCSALGRSAVYCATTCSCQIGSTQERFWHNRHNRLISSCAIECCQRGRTAQCFNPNCGSVQNSYRSEWFVVNHLDDFCNSMLKFIAPTKVHRNKMQQITRLNICLLPLLTLGLGFGVCKQFSWGMCWLAQGANKYDDAKDVLLLL